MKPNPVNIFVFIIDNERHNFAQMLLTSPKGKPIKAWASCLDKLWAMYKDDPSFDMERKAFDKAVTLHLSFAQKINCFAKNLEFLEEEYADSKHLRAIKNHYRKL